MEQQNKFLKASIFYLLGNIVGQGIVLLSSAIFTRIMDKEAYGLVNTYSAWVLVLNTFIGLNLFITVRNAYIDYREEYEKFTSSILSLSLKAFVGFMVVIILTVKMFALNVDIFVILIAGIQAISVHTVNYQMAIYSMKNDYVKRTLLMVLPNIVHTILSIILVYVYTQNQYYAKIVGNAVGIFLFALLAIVEIFKKNWPEVNKEYYRYALAISVPAIFYTLSDLILMQSDRIMITNMVGAKETAVYSLVYNIGSILIALYTAINGAWTPWFYQKLAMADFEAVCKVQKKYILLFFTISVGVLNVSPEVIKILSPKSYWGGINYVNLIVISSYLIFIYSFFTTFLMYHKQTTRIAINTIISAMLNIIMNYFLIIKFKSIGAAYATIVSYAILFALHFAAIRKEDRKNFAFLDMIISVIAICVYGCIFFLIKDLWIIRYAILSLIAIFMLVQIKKYIEER